MALVLIVDDSPEYRTFLRDLLEIDGHTVIDAESGRDALRLLDQWGERVPKLIIIDQKMPQMTGFELVREIKGRPSTRNVPMAMLTAMGPELQALAQEENVHYMTKNQGSKQLLDELRRILPPTVAPPTPPRKPFQIDRKFY